MRLVHAVAVFLGLASALVTVLSTDGEASSQDLCASPSCMLTNGTLCDRASQDCPKCLEVAPLLEMPICTMVVGGEWCLSDTTLCLEPPASSSSSDDGYDWQLQSSASGSEESSTHAISTLPPNWKNTLSPTVRITQTPQPTTAPATNTVLPNDQPSSTTTANTRNDAKDTGANFPGWLFVALGAIATVGILLILVAFVVQRRRLRRGREQRGRLTIATPCVGDDFEYSKREFSPNSHGLDYELSMFGSLASTRVNRAQSGSSQSSIAVDDVDSARTPLASSFVPAFHRAARPPYAMSLPSRQLTNSSQPRGTRSLPPLQPPSKTPEWRPSRTSTSSSKLSAFYELPPPRPSSKSPSPPRSPFVDTWSASDRGDVDFTFTVNSDESKSDAQQTSHTDASQFADSNYVDVDALRPSTDTGTPISETSSSVESYATALRNEAADVDIYPDTSQTTLSERGRMFSPLSVRSRDTAAYEPDEMEEWSSRRVGDDMDAADKKREEQEQTIIAKWKSKYYMQL